MSEEAALVHMETMDVRRHGGSLEITLPSHVAKFLDVGQGDRVCFFKDEKHHLIVMVNGKDALGRLPGFNFRMGFSVSKELMEKVLAEKK